MPDPRRTAVHPWRLPEMSRRDRCESATAGRRSPRPETHPASWPETCEVTAPVLDVRAALAERFRASAARAVRGSVPDQRGD